MAIIFTVKELAEITNISRRNIRYYDSVGLFKPSFVGDNGYRYYELEKVEELRLIKYLRHAGISIEEIKQHFENRNIDEYVEILNKQLSHLNNEINDLSALKIRLENKLESIEHIKGITEFNEVKEVHFPKRHILKMITPLKTLLEWEHAFLELENALPPSLSIGDNGFLMNLSKINESDEDEFHGLFMFADDPYKYKSPYLEPVESGLFLRLYVKGNHKIARQKYETILKYAQENGYTLGEYAFERTLIDHFISSDKELYITEIQIPVRREAS